MRSDFLSSSHIISGGECPQTSTITYDTTSNFLSPTTGYLSSLDTRLVPSLRHSSQHSSFKKGPEPDQCGIRTKSVIYNEIGKFS